VNIFGGIKGKFNECKTGFEKRHNPNFTFIFVVFVSGNFNMAVNIGFVFGVVSA